MTPLDEYVVHPNHEHLSLALAKESSLLETVGGLGGGELGLRGVSTHHIIIGYGTNYPSTLIIHYFYLSFLAFALAVLELESLQEGSRQHDRQPVLVVGVTVYPVQYLVVLQN